MSKKHLMSKENSFVQWLVDNSDPHNLFSPELDYDKAIHFLRAYLLGEDWYSCSAGNGKQINCDIVDSILFRYSRKYRRELKRVERRWRKT